MYKEKIAVFDLDDTLYISNSHIEMLSEYYNTYFFKSILFRILGRISNKVYMNIINKLYNNIPIEVKNKFTIPFVKDIVELLQEKKEDGYYVLIISNAPVELISSASKRLNIDYIRAGFNKKSLELNKRFTYKKLFVCTDNKTDIDLLNIATEAVITCKKRHEKFFYKNIKCREYIFKSIRNSYKFGCEKFGPFLYGYTLWLINELKKSNLSKVYFFARDGYMMQKAFNVMYHNNDIKNWYICVSRRSLRQPLLHYCQTYAESLQYMNKNRFITAKACLEYYGFNDNECDCIADKYSFKLNDDWQYEDLLNNKTLGGIYEEYKSIIDDKSMKQDKILKEYFKQLDFTGKVAIVDIGWHGSMQIYLEKYLALSGIKANVSGFYVGIDPPQKLRDRAKGYLFSKHDDNLRKRVLCFLGGAERLFQALHGSTIGYTENMGKVEPVYDKFEYDEDDAIINSISDFQNGAMEYIYAKEAMNNGI